MVLHHLGDGTHFQKFSVAHGDGFRERILAIDGVKLAVNQNEIGFTEGNHKSSRLRGEWSGLWEPVSAKIQLYNRIAIPKYNYT